MTHTTFTHASPTQLNHRETTLDAESRRRLNRRRRFAEGVTARRSLGWGV